MGATTESSKFFIGYYANNSFVDKRRSPLYKFKIPNGQEKLRNTLVINPSPGIQPYHREGTPSFFLRSKGFRPHIEYPNFSGCYLWMDPQITQLCEQKGLTHESYKTITNKEAVVKWVNKYSQRLSYPGSLQRELTKTPISLWLTPIVKIYLQILHVKNLSIYLAPQLLQLPPKGLAPK